MNTGKMSLAILVTIVALLLSACGTSGEPIPSATIPPTIEDEDSPTARVIEHTILSSVGYLDEPSPTKSPDGDQFYAVAIEFESKGKPYSAMLKLDEIKLTAKDGSSFSPLTLTIGPGESTSIADLAFYKGIGKSDKTLDFGVGFSGMELSMSESYSEGKKVALTMYHGENGMRLTFLFQIPVSSEADVIQLPDFQQMPLN